MQGQNKQHTNDQYGNHWNCTGDNNLVYAYPKVWMEIKHTQELWKAIYDLIVSTLSLIVSQLALENNLIGIDRKSVV